MKIFRLMLSRRWWWTTLLVLIGIGVTIRLGFWQISRYHENMGIAEHLLAMETADPLKITSKNTSIDLTANEFRNVQAAGVFDFSHQVAIRNQVWVQPWGNDVGYRLVAPLVLPDGSAILVDRGWIPLANNDPSAWKQFDQSGQAVVTGIVRLSTKPQFGGPTAPTLAPGQTSSAFWNLIDIPSLQKQMPYPLLAVYIEQAPEGNSNPMPYKALTQPDTTPASTNVGYAFTWFSFAALLFGGYPVYLNKQVPEAKK